MLHIISAMSFFDYHGKGSGKPHPMFGAKPDEVPDGVLWTQKGGQGYCQLQPNDPPQEPSALELFNNSKSENMVEYPRYLKEPKVECGNGHSVFLSRIPWQSGCKECAVPGLNKWMIFFCWCVCFSIGQ